MKKVLYLSSILLWMSVISCDTERNVSPDFRNYFVKYYGEDGNQRAVDMIADDASETVTILGSSDVRNERWIYLLKTDFEGTVLWEETLGDGNENPQDIELGIDGNYIILSNSDIGGNAHQVKLLRVSADGAPIDSVYTLGNWSDVWANSVTALSDGGYVVTGYTPDTNATYNADITNDQQDIINIRFLNDLSLDPSWSLLPIGGQSQGEGVKIFEKNPGLFYLFGRSDALHKARTNLNMDFYIVDLSATGVVGAPIFVGQENDLEAASFAIQSPPELGSVFFMGGTLTSGSSVELYFVKLFSEITFDENVKNTSGDPFVPTRDFEQGVVPSAVFACGSTISTPGFIIVSDITDPQAGSDLLLSKVDLNGLRLWSETFGYTGNNDHAASVAELPDGRILVLGTVFLHNQDKISLFKLNARGQLSN